MSRKHKITLNCGVKAENWGSGDTEYLQISLIDLYNGYGDLNNPTILALLFSELAQHGYTLNGMSREVGYYDSTDDLLLTATKNL